MTTTPSPEDYARFYMMFPDNAPMNRENQLISFTLPTGKTFPHDLIGIMNKTKRFLSFDQSEVKGMTTPQCNGKNCVCKNCPQPELICNGVDCKAKGSSYSTYGITCNNSLCIISNHITYSMYPLYPVDMCLPQYKPKFKFIDYISSKQITTKDLQENYSIVQTLFKDGETIPPLDTLVLPNLVLFSITYPIHSFNTQDKFAELYEIITYTNNFITLLKKEKLVQHNIATLQKVIKKNKLQMIDFKIGTKEFIKKSIIKKQLKEPYTEQIELKNLHVPITEKDDTLMIPNILLVPEHDTKKWSGWKFFKIFFILGLIIIAIICIIFTMNHKPKTKPQSKKSNKKK